MVTIVADLDLIVRFWVPLADQRVSRRLPRSIVRFQRPDLDVISGSGRGRFAALSDGHPAQRIRNHSRPGPMLQPGVDQDIVADQAQTGWSAVVRTTDIAVAADPDIGADHGNPTRSPSRRPDFGMGADHRQRDSTITPVFQMRRGVGGR